jgi:hypothetical protein
MTRPEIIEGLILLTIGILAALVAMHYLSKTLDLLSR